MDIWITCKNTRRYYLWLKDPYLVGKEWTGSLAKYDGSGEMFPFIASYRIPGCVASALVGSTMMGGDKVKISCVRASKVIL